MGRHARHAAVDRRRGAVRGTAPRAVPGRLRRLFTPHFFVGFGVVALACVSYAGTRTYLDFHVGQDAQSGCSGPCQAGSSVDDGSPSAEIRVPGAAGPTDPGSVRITYRTAATWGSGFQARVAITNTGRRTIDDWRLRFRYPRVRVRTAWNAALLRSGSAPVITGLERGGAIAPGRTVRFRFSGAGAAGQPTDCSFNEKSCVFR